MFDNRQYFKFGGVGVKPQTSELTFTYEIGHDWIALNG